MVRLGIIGYFATPQGEVRFERVFERHRSGEWRDQDGDLPTPAQRIALDLFEASLLADPQFPREARS